MKHSIWIVLLFLMIQGRAQTPAWKTRLLHYIHTSLAKEDGGYGWEDQYDSHLEPCFAVVGILRDIDALPANKDSLIAFIRTHHPQHQLNRETGPSGFVPRTLLYEQIQSILWLGGDVSDLRATVLADKGDTRNLYNYEDHGYGVFDQEAMTLVNNHLVGNSEGYPGLAAYIGVRRRENGSFNNAPAATGGDGNVLSTYWGLYALQIMGKTDEKKSATVQWLQACELSNGGFTHQPHPVIGGNDDVAYTWAAVKALQLLSAKPAREEACIRYLVSLENADGGFGNRPGLPSTPMSTYYALDALKTLGALDKLDKAKPNAARHDPTPDFNGYKVFTIQIQAIGNGSPVEAVVLADSFHIQLWGAKNAPAGWVEAAQKIADQRGVKVYFFHADEPYGKNVIVQGMGSFGHILDNYYPAGVSLTIPDSALWQDQIAHFLPDLKGKNGGLYLQISNNEPLVRMLMDQSIKDHQGYTAISTIHFGQNFLFFLPFLYQYRHLLPFVALQDAHGTESWWWSNDLLAYRTLFLAKEPTYTGFLDALKKNQVVAVRHDSLTFNKTRMLGGAPGVQEYIKSQTNSWRWWDTTTNELYRPWSILTVVMPADTFEVARPDKGAVIRIRPWWHTDKQIMKFPLVVLRQLSVDGRPVECDYVEHKNRMGVVVDSYYLYKLPAAPGEHTIQTICRNIRTGVDRTETQKIVVP